MPKQLTGRLCHQRTSWRDLRSPHRRMLPSHQSGASRLLLANTQGRRPRLYQEMQTMPRVYRCATYSSWQSPKFELHLALRHVGYGHIGTIAKGPRSNQIPISHHQLLHQVNRSKTTARNCSQRGGEIHPKTPHLQVWPPIHHCNRQRHSIQSWDLRKLPDKARHQAPSHLCRTSSDQRLGRGS